MTPQETAAQTADRDLMRRDNVALAGKLADTYAVHMEAAHATTDHTEYTEQSQKAMANRALLLELVNDLSR